MSQEEAVSAPRERFVRYPITWATYAMVGYFAYQQTVLGPLMPFLREEHGFSYTVASLHFSAFALGGLPVGFFGDRATGRWGRRTSLWGGGVGMAAGALLLAVSPVTVGTVLGALLMGTFGALLLITTQAVLADKYGKWGAVAITESNIAASVCAISASLAVGGFAALGLDWRAALVPPVAVLALLAIRFAGEPLGRARTRETVSDRATSALPRRFWVFSGVLFLGVSVEWCVAYWGADFLENGVGLERSAAATALSVFFVAMLAGRVLGSRLARSLPSGRLLLITLCVALAGFPLFWLSAVPALSLLGLFVVGLGVGSVYPLAISVGVAAADGRTDTATARLGLAGGGAILTAPFVLGAFADRVGIEWAYGIVVPLLVAAIVLVLFSSSAQ
ncbi:MAG TPA: MFS transporter [Rubrobacteraceae bacterium]|nr:MFS transporter [Rubrobacteraceae bacterium]